MDDSEIKNVKNKEKLKKKLKNESLKNKKLLTNGTVFMLASMMLQQNIEQSGSHVTEKEHAKNGS
jgi:hypothetical protein